MMPSAPSELKVWSFFSGAMGLDLGLEQAGLKVVLACDVDPNCRATIAANRPNLPVLSDVWRYDAATLRELAQKLGPIDVMVCGPPCQAFSTAGARKGFADARGNVFLYYLELLLDLKPRYLVLENVRGLLLAPLVPPPLTASLPPSQRQLLSGKGGALCYILERLRAGGYQVSFNLYNAANFGVPQLRERVVIFGTRSGPKMPYLVPTHSADSRWGLPPWRTLRMALAGLPATPCDHLQFPPQRLRFYRLLRAGQNWRNLPPKLQPLALGQSYYVRGGKTGFYRRLAWDQPACTLVTSPTMPATDICHPDLDRPLSVQEYRRIQMFPDDWRICGNLAAQYKQIGNAVPVGLGRAIGRVLSAYARGEVALAPPGFAFSRYRATDEVAWEAATRQQQGLKAGETLLERPELAAVVALQG